ncbi:solute carrier family 2, facilitated glucose transporter member 8-like [Pollicipes pollicipes]|uniref:solute carrier family 2, facilitated glucose transporter member 8-like n=1 Tax=Pollicipes pollicipes TaxID=41117 RepID=UPI0018858675|nr:solute carrier family 2, facilitated glucose transporter member 8-like [Pollicipes pollicipes]
MGKGRQILGSVAANGFLTAYGLLEGYTTPALPQLRRSGSGLAVSDEDASWIGSIFLLGIALGTPLQGLMLAFGRRRSLMLVSPVMCLGSLLMTFPTSVEMLLAGRFLNGLGMGSVLPMAHIFISETVAPELRGALVGSGMFCINVGLIAVYSMGFFLTWQQIGGVIATFYGLYPLVLWRLPETPNWLATHNRDEEAHRSLLFYSGDQGAEAELARIKQRSLAHNPDLPPLGEVRQRAFYMPLIISITVTICKATSGTPAIHLYSYDMFLAVGGNADPLLASVVSTALSSVGSVFAFVLMDRAGRRPLFILAMFTCGACWVTIALAAMFIRDPIATDWVAILGFSVALFVYNIGIGPVGMVIMGEMIPLRYRTVISPVQSMIMWISSFAIGKTFFQLRDGLHFYGLCFLYASTCLLFTLLGYLLVPETKGKTLSEIEELFEKRALPASRKASVEYGVLGNGETVGVNAAPRPPAYGTEATLPQATLPTHDSGGDGERVTQTA